MKKFSFSPFCSAVASASNTARQRFCLPNATMCAVSALDRCIARLVSCTDCGCVQCGLLLLLMLLLLLLLLRSTVIPLLLLLSGLAACGFLLSTDSRRRAAHCCSAGRNRKHSDLDTWLSSIAHTEVHALFNGHWSTVKTEPLLWRSLRCIPAHTMPAPCCAQCEC
jgi:hypothetical protein